MGEDRIYRRSAGSPRLSGYRVCVKETDLWIQTCRPMEDIARESVFKYRGYIESYISEYPSFLYGMAPVAAEAPAPRIVRDMAAAALSADVGPMAAVAGALAEYVGSDLLAGSSEVVVENGGDVFVKLEKPFTLAIDAGDSPLSYKIGLELDSAEHPLGVCTSSATVGHSFSYGRADAVCVVSGSCTLADAAATAICNRVASASDIDGAIAFAREIPGVSAVAIIVRDRIGVWGDVSVVPINRKKINT